MDDFDPIVMAREFNERIGEESRFLDDILLLEKAA
jgi:hypothetical protein